MCELFWSGSHCWLWNCGDISTHSWSWTFQPQTPNPKPKILGFLVCLLWWWCMVMDIWLSTTLECDQAPYICFRPNAHMINLCIGISICAYFDCPRMRNLPIMSDSGHVGANVRIVSVLLSFFAHIGDCFFVSFCAEKEMLGSLQTGIPVYVMGLHEQLLFAH